MNRLHSLYFEQFIIHQILNFSNPLQKGIKPMILKCANVAIIYLFGDKYLKPSKPKIFCLRNRITLRFDFLQSFMVCAQTYAFLV